MPAIPKTLLVSEIFWPVAGGSARWFDEVYRRYPAQTAAVLTRPEKDRPRDDQREHLPVFRRSMRWRPRLKPFDFLEIAAAMGLQSLRLTRRNRYQIVHCGRVFPEGFAGWFLQRTLGLPYVIYVHGEEVSRYLRYRMESRILPVIFRSAARVIANSRNSAALAEQGGADPGVVRVIYPGVDTQRFHANADGRVFRRQHGLGDAKVLLTVGRLTRRKGQARVIQCLPRLRTVFGDVRYVIVGGGEDEAMLRQKAREHGVENAVVFTGSLDDTGLLKAYAACDLFVMPTTPLGDGDIEGFGMVYIEANACGKAVVAGRCGGVGEAVLDGQTGLLIDPTRDDELEGTITNLLRHPERAHALGEAGRIRAVNEFSWQSIVERTQQLLPLEEPRK